MPRRKLRGTVLYWRAQAELPIPEMRELAVWRMLRRFRGPILGDESAVTNSLCLAVPLFDLILGDLSSNERHS